MDNQTAQTNPIEVPNPSSNMFKKLLTRKTIFIILGFVVLGELIWAVSAIFNTPSVTPATPVKVSVATKEKVVKASLTTEKAVVKVWEKLTVNLELSSQGMADGVDMIIHFDPKLVSVDLDADKLPVKPMLLFREYPQNSLDPANPGRIIISGITDQTGGTLAEGILGTMNFTAKAVGKATFRLEFIPGSTTDSNIIES